MKCSRRSTDWTTASDTTDSDSETVHVHIRFRNDYVMPLATPVATENPSSHKNSEVQIPISQGEETFFLFVLQTTWRSLIATNSYTCLERGHIQKCPIHRRTSCNFFEIEFYTSLLCSKNNYKYYMHVSFSLLNAS